MIFESDRDRAAQFAAAFFIAERWRCSIEITPPLSPFDYLISRGDRLRAIGEYKRRYRRAPSDRGFFKISRAKFITLRLSAKWLDVPGLIFAEFDGGAIFHCDARAVTGYRIARDGGRAPRDGAAHDVEAMVLIPIPLFRRMQRREGNGESEIRIQSR